MRHGLSRHGFWRYGLRNGLGCGCLYLDDLAWNCIGRRLELQQLASLIDLHELPRSNALRNYHLVRHYARHNRGTRRRGARCR